MSAPPSACWPPVNPLRAVSTRPPTRSRASRTTTSAPIAARSRAAARPASPAPATSTRTPVSIMGALQLLDGITLGLEHLQQAVGADEVGRADHDERARRAGDERFDLRQPVPVALDEQALVHLWFLLDVLEHDPF